MELCQLIFKDNNYTMVKVLGANGACEFSIIMYKQGRRACAQWVNDNVVRIGEAILPFYFCTKCIENVAQGIEKHRYEMKMDNSDSDNKTIE